jgi:spermidine/putrescine transport system ATP-binding protein
MNPAWDVEVRGLEKRYGLTVALHDVSLAVAPGEFFTLLGPSGCGKTTTLRSIAGFVAPTAGEVRIRGMRVNGVPPHRRRVGMVFQHYALFPHRTVFQNVAFGLRMQGTPRADIAALVAEALALVQLGDHARRYPRQLSGGEQQRVALARALVTRPSVLLLDEPLGALDKKLRGQMQVELRRLQRSVGITAIYVTHDQEEALTMSDRIAVMRGGRVEQVGTPAAIYERPTTLFVADFIGDTNLLPVRVSGSGLVECRGVKLRADTAGLAVDTPATLALRPEKLQLDPPGPVDNNLDVSVTQVIYAGETVRYLLRGPEGLALAAVELGQVRFEPGAALRAAWPSGSARLLRD